MYENIPVPISHTTLKKSRKDDCKSQSIRQFAVRLFLLISEVMPIKFQSSDCPNVTLLCTNFLQTEIFLQKEDEGVSRHLRSKQLTSLKQYLMLTRIISHLFSITEQVKLAGKVTLSNWAAWKITVWPVKLPVRYLAVFADAAFMSYHVGWDTDTFELTLIL